ncbi:MAG: branched-chain amino acid ABC transporter permease [Alphaproteobacteria bacterium]|nr:branched-chain amino acid ABC transporter permease [Alphaproteobacteria bacterium]MBO6863213.1 branched-chain amino acid ABC transporter permease [Alphaproteobacteria bacterium]MEC9265628.1 branched-chain amino acid ABC transporter permease [Pseudomonadota bacterium]
MSLALQVLFDALLLGGLYAIGALGFALVWGVQNILNVAYAAMIMLGAYAAYWVWTLGVDPILAVPVVMAMMFVVGLLLQRFLFDYVMLGPHSLSIALTYGVNLVLIGLALYLFTAEYRSIALPDHLRGSITVGGAHLTNARIVTIVIALTLTASVWWLMDRTALGAAIRATRMDLDAARLVGIRPRLIYNIVAGISGALAGAMGALLAVIHSVFPAMGDHQLIQILIVLVLGGLGSMVGPLVGALLLGLVSSVVTAIWGGTYAVLAGTILVLLVLTFRPSGLMGRKFYEA